MSYNKFENMRNASLRGLHNLDALVNIGFVLVLVPVLVAVDVLPLFQRS
jgi:hypothetical protein